VRKREGEVRIYARRGADWTHRFPLIVQAANRLKASSLYLDGEGVVCGSDGVAIIDKLHSKANDDAVFLCAFDLLELNSDDLRAFALAARVNRNGFRNLCSGTILHALLYDTAQGIFASLIFPRRRAPRASILS
jgi:hypothetical protein